MKYLLGIEGVMIPFRSLQYPYMQIDNFPDFSVRSVITLNGLIEQTNAEIVLTTSLKYEYSLEKWKEMFLDRGVRVQKISRLQENKDNLSRKDEILRWIKQNPGVVFRIIDDDKSLHDLPEEIKIHSKITNPQIGLDY